MATKYTEVSNFYIFDVKDTGSGYDIFIDPLYKTWVTVPYDFYVKPKKGQVAKIRHPEVLVISDSPTTT